MRNRIVLCRIQLEGKYPRAGSNQACGDCTLHESNGELAITSSEIDKGTAEGTLKIIGLLGLGGGQNRPSDFGTITFPVPRDNFFLAVFLQLS